MNRRRFLARSATALAAPLAVGPFVHAADKAGSKPAIVGAGEHTYECHHGWGQLPPHVKWFETHGVTIGPDGLIYISHHAGPGKPASPDQAQDTVVVFDPDGKCVRTFGKAWHGGGHGIDLRIEAGKPYLYLSQIAPINLVVKTDLEGNVVWSKDRTVLAGSHVYDDPKAAYSPTNVAFNPDGGFYIADGYGSSYVHHLDADGNWLKTFGGNGDQPGYFKTPHGIYWDNRPIPHDHDELVVADRANLRLQRLDANGAPRSIQTDGMRYPTHFDSRGDVLMVADLHALVTLLDRDNKVITQLGGGDDAWIEEVKKMQIRSDPSRWRDGKFIHPHDACFDPHGNIYVTEWVVPGRVTFLRKVS